MMTMVKIIRMMEIAKEDTAAAISNNCNKGQAAVDKSSSTKDLIINTNEQY